MNAEKEVSCMGRLITLQCKNADELFLRTGVEEDELAYQINKQKLVEDPEFAKLMETSQKRVQIVIEEKRP